jgi:hypothetical protein
VSPNGQTDRVPRRRHSYRPLSVRSSHWRADGQPKVRYPTQRDALSAADERGRESDVDLGVYRCDFCGGWHMGRSGRRED